MRLLVFGLSRDKLGGIETFLLGMNENMSRECVFDYVVLQGDSFDDKCIHAERINARGGRIHYVTPYSRNPIKYFVDLLYIIREHKKQNPQAIAYINLFSMVHMLPGWICHLLGYHVVLHAHNRGFLRISKIYRAIHYLNKLISSGHDYMRIANSQPSAEFMFGRKDANRTEIIYTAIDVEKYRFNPIVRLQCREYYHLGECPVVGFVGRLSPEKNPLFAIDVFAEVLKTMPEAILLIVGDGILRSDIEQRVWKSAISDRIIITGNRNDVHILYQAMDVLLLPTTAEGSGMVLVEAQSSGLPCVVTRNAVPDNVKIIDSIFVTISKDESPSIWAQEIIDLLSHKMPRDSTYSVVMDSRFNIKTEALVLEQLLMKSLC